MSASAKDKLIMLSDADAAALQGKSVAVTIHERPGFSAMTAGKATFGLLGAAAMYSAGNALVKDNDIKDPAEIVRMQLAASLASAYGANVLATDTAPTEAKKPKEIAATHPQADYVLDVRSVGWMYAYFPTQWGTYWVGYSAQVQLVDKSGRQVSNAACNTHTRENKHPPSREQLHADNAQLLKDVTAALGWTCTQLLAKDQFHFPADKIAATPAQFADPLAVAAETATAATMATAVAPAPSPSAAAATTAAADAPADAVTHGETKETTADGKDSGAGGSNH
ncbi:hypothetical protein [Lysobacter sp. GCM10012299]|uniref:hypothetical protein n=1 Tax=Lysobacter sp. GCM10012299 TaxID=3317333 RepID=UPI0036078928